MYFYSETENRLCTSDFIRRANPQVSFPKVITEEMAESFGYKKVKVIEVQEEFGYELHTSDVQMIDGIPTITQTLVPMDPMTVKRKRVALFKASIDAQLQAAAFHRGGYKDIDNAASFAVEGSEFYEDGVYFRDLRDSVWVRFNELVGPYFEDLEDTSNSFWEDDIVISRL